MARFFTAGLSVPNGPAPTDYRDIPTTLTDEAGLIPAPGEELRINSLVAEDDIVSQGQPLLCLRADTQIQLVAPMAARVASIETKPGRRLTQLVLFREDRGDRFSHDVTGLRENAERLRVVMKASGLWRRVRSRPFGHMPASGEMPAAIMVMATDSRPGAPAPAHALKGREEALVCGLEALATIAPERVFLCEARKAHIAADLPMGIQRIAVGGLHPEGLAGIQVHRHAPASLEARIWDIHAEDVADLGELIQTGFVPETRMVTVTGPALTAPRVVRCQPGADMRGLSASLVRPGPHHVIAGSHIDGHPGHFLGPRDRQVTVLTHGAGHRRGHWFSAALTKAARPLPIIPTAALEQALGNEIHAAALIRALAAGDQESAIHLGALSLVEEDLALADYVTAAEPPLAAQLRGLLNRIEKEEVAA